MVAVMGIPAPALDELDALVIVRLAALVLVVRFREREEVVMVIFGADSGESVRSWSAW